MAALLELVSSLVWPVTTVVLALMFRQEIRAIAARISRFRLPGFEADLQNAEAEVSALAEETISQDPREVDSTAMTILDRLYHIADASPRAAIMEAWREIELATKRVAEEYGIPVSGRIAGTSTVQELIRKGLMPERFLHAYTRLRKVRSSAAHAHDFQIDEAEADRYLDTAYSFLRTLFLLLDEASSDRPE